MKGETTCWISRWCFWCVWIYIGKGAISWHINYEKWDYLLSFQMMVLNCVKRAVCFWGVWIYIMKGALSFYISYERWNYLLSFCMMVLNCVNIYRQRGTIITYKLWKVKLPVEFPDGVFWAVWKGQYHYV